MKNQPGAIARMIGLIFGAIGACMLIPGAIMTAVYHNGVRDGDLLIAGGILMAIGGVFALVCLCALVSARRLRVRVERLKREGRCYEARVTRVYENMYMHVNMRHPLIVECGYKDDMGKTYLVKSGNVWLSPLLVRENSIKARVYVNPGDPRDYYVDVYTDAYADDAGAAYDYDLR